VSRRVFKNSDLDLRLRGEGYLILDLLTGEDTNNLSKSFAQFSYCHRYDFSTTVLTEEFAVRKKVHQTLSAVLSRRLLSVLDNYKIILASYAVKLPQAPDSRVGLHQDFTFIDEQSGIGLSIWCPLVEVNQDNGWLGVVRGSQAFNSNLREASSLPYPDLIDMIEEKYLTYLPMRPGQVLFMDNRVFHSSSPNRSAQSRLVAAGLAVPAESQLLCCHYDAVGHEGHLEVYEVPDDFYLRHMVGSRPHEGRRIADATRIVSPLTEEMIAARQAELGTEPPPHLGESKSTQLLVEY
jgi:hypothetical protein